MPQPSAVSPHSLDVDLAFLWIAAADVRDSIARTRQVIATTRELILAIDRYEAAMSALQRATLSAETSSVVIR
jgi:hypothetical protein